MICILREFYKNWFRDKSALESRLRQPTNARFKLRNSQNRKWADENSSKQLLWIKMAWTLYFFFVEVIISKQKSNRKLGHVIQIQVDRLPDSWLWISLLDVLKHESFCSISIRIQLPSNQIPKQSPKDLLPTVLIHLRLCYVPRYSRHSP